MSFNLVFLSLFLLGCGVKSLPTAPKDSSYPSYQSQFLPAPTPTPARPSQPDLSE